MNLSQLKRIRWGVRTVLSLGVAASIAGNVLHAHGGVISQIISAWSPLALLLTIELISRVPVHRRTLAWGRWAATAVIAGIAAWVSYWHMAAVASRYGETGGAQYMLPLSVDGLVVVASICLVELGGRISGESGVIVALAAADPEPAEQVSPDPWMYATPIGPVPVPDAPADAVEQVTARTTRRQPRALTSAQKVAKAAAKLPDGTVAQIAARAGVSPSTVRRHLPVAGGASPSEPVPAETTPEFPVNGASHELMEVTR
ncbi:DUF2637 domain-containing protein [Plantactinospora siamensis]|uniref:DUF2637 domain-containing protein n=1 Tax=Plantactinospora siamensis TaxID=555372 RepID=A0ABV6P6N0_9ACTN